MSRIRLPDCSKLAINWKNKNDVKICWHDFIIQFFMKLPCFSSLSFMPISWQILVWQFWFIRDCPEIRKPKIPPSEFFPISRDWASYGYRVYWHECLIKSYWKLQNARITVLTVSELRVKPELAVKWLINAKSKQARFTGKDLEKISSKLLSTKLLDVFLLIKFRELFGKKEIISF